VMDTKNHYSLQLTKLANPFLTSLSTQFNSYRTKYNWHPSDPRLQSLTSQGSVLYKNQISPSQCDKILDIAKHSLSWRRSFSVQRFVGTQVSYPPSPQSLLELYSIVDNILCVIGAYNLMEDPRIDGINFVLTKTVGDNPNTSKSIPVSQCWHRDSIGTRFLFFFVLATFDNHMSTEFLSQTNIFDYDCTDLEMVRTNDQLRCISDQESVYHRLAEEFPFARHVKYNIHKGSLLAFDTNCFHRAYPYIQDVYSSKIDLAKSMSSRRLHVGCRLILMVELMNREHSNFCVANKLGPCGPGNPPNVESTIICRARDVPKLRRLDSNCFISPDDALSRLLSASNLNQSEYKEYRVWPR